MKKILTFLLIAAMLLAVGCKKNVSSDPEVPDNNDPSEVVSDVKEPSDNTSDNTGDSDNNQTGTDDTQTPGTEDPGKILPFSMPYDYGDNVLVARDEAELRTLRWAQAAARQVAYNKGYFPCEIEISSIDSLNLGMAAQDGEMVEMYRVSYVMSYNFMMYGEIEGYEATGRGYIPSDPSTEALLALYFDDYNGQRYTVMAGCFSEADAREAALSAGDDDPLNPYRKLAAEAMEETQSLVENSINANYGPDRWNNHALIDERIGLRVIGYETVFGPGSLDNLDSLGIGYREESYYQPGHGTYDAWMGFDYPTLDGSSYFTGLSGNQVLLSVHTSNPEVETPLGIHPGSTSTELLAKYPDAEAGSPPNLYGLGDNYYFYCPSSIDYEGEEEWKYNGPTLLFEMDGDEVVGISAYMLLD
ncbi:MAG: hypothetical protein GX975_01825 [Clostridiales bacterium]|nr:hypothetical protein [Clostridiales bacterium]